MSDGELVIMHYEILLNNLDKEEVCDFCLETFSPYCGKILLRLLLKYRIYRFSLISTSEWPSYFLNRYTSIRTITLYELQSTCINGTCTINFYRYLLCSYFTSLQ